MYFLNVLLKLKIQSHAAVYCSKNILRKSNIVLLFYYDQL